MGAVGVGGGSISPKDGGKGEKILQRCGPYDVLHEIQQKQAS
jgi:hypothetical protein